MIARENANFQIKHTHSLRTNFHRLISMVTFNDKSFRLFYIYLIKD